MLRNAENRLGRLTVVLEMRLHDADYFHRLLDVPVAYTLFSLNLQATDKVLEQLESGRRTLVDHRKALANLDVPLGVSHRVSRVWLTIALQPWRVDFLRAATVVRRSWLTTRLLPVVRMIPGDGATPDS